MEQIYRTGQTGSILLISQWYGTIITAGPVYGIDDLGSHLYFYKKGGRTHILPKAAKRLEPALRLHNFLDKT